MFGLMGRTKGTHLQFQRPVGAFSLVLPKRLVKK